MEIVKVTSHRQLPIGQRYHLFKYLYRINKLPKYLGVCEVTGKESCLYVDNLESSKAVGVVRDGCLVHVLYTDRMTKKEKVKFRNLLIKK